MRFMFLKIALFSLVAFASDAKTDVLPTTPNLYQSPRAIPPGCDAKKLAMNILHACNQRYANKHEQVLWDVLGFASKICHGHYSLVGQKTLYSVYGDKKRCAGEAATPRQESWVCNIKIAEDYSVRAKAVYYSTCQH